jgi:tetratricopeptide (TPR) repeat protein
MSASRLEQLLEFYREDPNDPFVIYALATEYLSIDEQKALQYFEGLLQWHSYYVGTYYHAAALYAKLGRREDAEKTYKNGLITALEVNDTKAHRELKAAYDEFLDE